MKVSDYEFNYEREVGDFYADHPQHKNRIFFLDVESRSLVGYRGEEARKITAILGTNPELSKTLATRHREGGSEAAAYPGLRYSCIFLDQRAYKERLTRLIAGPEASGIENAFTLDHEIGHLICPDGIEKFNLRECVADAYATIRHIQRFGADSPYLQNIVPSRAMGLVFEKGEGSHFTSPVTEKIIEDAGTAGFERLSPEETVAKASHYARTYAVPEQEVKAVSHAFNDFKGHFSEIAGRNFKPVRVLAEKILKTDKPLEAKWGGVALRTIFNSKVVFENKPAPLPPDSFKKLRRALDAKMART